MMTRTRLLLLVGAVFLVSWPALGQSWDGRVSDGDPLRARLLIPGTEAVAQSQTPGASYCGPYSVSAPLEVFGISGTTISGLQIANPTGNSIKLVNCSNITIQACKLGPSLGNGIELFNCSNITIVDCRMESVATGVYAVQSEGISVTHIEVVNVQGPPPRGQMVQFNTVTGIGNRVNYNVAENLPGQSTPEDVINMFKTSGTAADPVQVIGNWIRGGGPSNSGGGIMLGDAGGAYLLAKDNVLVDPGQYGMAISSGTDIQIIGNTIYARRQPFTNVGIYVWNQYPSVCANNTVSGNKVNWTDSSGQSNPAWAATNCKPVLGWDHNAFPANIGPSVLPKTIISCGHAAVSKRPMIHH